MLQFSMLNPALGGWESQYEPRAPYKPATACVQTLHPFSDSYISSAVLQAPEAAADTQLPSVQLVSRAAAGEGNDRLELQLRLPGPGFFGCVLLEGEMLGWSLPVLDGVKDKKVCCGP